MNRVILVSLCVLVLGMGYIIWRLMIKLQTVKIQQQELDEYVVEVEAIYDRLRGIRHDYRNHLQVIDAYANQSDLTALRDYLKLLTNELNQVDTLIRTGNTLIDALVNTKLTRAASAGVEVKAEAIAPDKLNIPSTDLAIILGNLLNNAIEATLKQQGDARIRLYIAPIKNNLYISMMNTMDDAPLPWYQSLKQPNRQGYGLRRIDAAVQANHGIVNRQWEEGVFVTEVTLPL